MDADREERRTSANAAQGPVRAILRLVGLVLQLLLCVTLLVWAVAAREVALAGIAGVLAMAAGVVLALELRRRRNAGSVKRAG